MRQSILDFVTSLSRGTFGIVITAETEPKMNKRENPYFGRVRKVTTISNAALGYSYAKTIQNRIERATGEKVEYKAETPKGRTWLIDNLILVSETNPSQQYLRVTMNKATKSSVQWLLDGQVVTDQETIDGIKSYLPEHKECHKQAEMGLSEEDQVIVRDFKFDSIKSIKQGEREWAA